MCDTVAVVAGDRVLFAKSSDRDPNEAQLLEWHPRRTHASGATVRCTWIEIPQVPETHGLLLSRPFWMWGAEMGANDQGVVLGNEAVFTRQPYARSGLTGMDLLRLALERADRAEAAVEVIVELLERHGQGGGCGYDHPRFTYHNSFLVADRRGAFVLETAGRKHRTERVEGARSISNALTIEGFAEVETDRLRSRVARAEERRARTSLLARSAGCPADMMALLRDHGGGSEPSYSLLGGGMGAPCMHAGGLLASSQTVASWVTELSDRGASHWVTGTAAPCTGLFKPVRVDEPFDLGPAPAGSADRQSLFWRHERLHRAVVTDPARLLALYSPERDAVEAGWLQEPPEPRTAFEEGNRLLATWTERVLAETGRDRRPAWVRRIWGRQSSRAGLGATNSPGGAP